MPPGRLLRESPTVRNYARSAATFTDGEGVDRAVVLAKVKDGKGTYGYKGCIGRLAARTDCQTAGLARRGPLAAG